MCLFGYVKIDYSKKITLYKFGTFEQVSGFTGFYIYQKLSKQINVIANDENTLIDTELSLLIICKFKSGMLYTLCKY